MGTVRLLEEHEDGSATYSFDLSEDEKRQLLEQAILLGIIRGVKLAVKEEMDQLEDSDAN